MWLLRDMKLMSRDKTHVMKLMSHDKRVYWSFIVSRDIIWMFAT